MPAYLIWSKEHQGWWAPGALGYVRHVSEAARYSHDEAMAVCRKALPGQWTPGTSFPEVPIAEADALELDAAGRKHVRRPAT